MPITIQDQLKCAQREVAARRANYPKWVSAGRLAQSKADHEIAAMDAIVATLMRQMMLEETSKEILGR